MPPIIRNTGRATRPGARLRRSTAIVFLLGFCAPGAVPAPAATGPVAVAVTPLAISTELSGVGLATAGLAAALEAELAQRGHPVTGPAQTLPIWEAVLDSIGGFYDTSTGEIDDAKEEAARRALCARVGARFGAGVVLRPRLELAEAEWRGGKAEWDGVGEGVGGVVGGGVVPALTLVVQVLDADGAVRCEDRGGVQVALKLTSGRRTRRVPVEKLLADAKRNARAVTLALECFTSGGGAKP